MATGMFIVPGTTGNILCCMCGIPIAPNPANRCVSCLQLEVDITDGLPKQARVLHCPKCESYCFNPERAWMKADWESKELLSFCVGLLAPKLKHNSVNVVHAEYVWTEPHSKRIKIRLKIQKEVINGAILEHSYLIEFVLQYRMCESCAKVQANPDQWAATVQLRQHVSHRRTLFYLEQVILKHDAAVHAIRIKQMDKGIDFFFANKSHARKFVDFMSRIAPVWRVRDSKELVPHDPKSNQDSYRNTYMVEVSPICREDLICLPQRVALSLGNLGPLVICTKVTNNICLLDPFTLRQASVPAEWYWRQPFESLMTSRQLVEYFVHNVEIVSPERDVGGLKFRLADVEVSRGTDFRNIFYVRTHLGHVLQPGDNALGYDLYGANINDTGIEQHTNLVLPDAILIKKSHGQSLMKKPGKPRPWKLKSLDMEADESIGRANQEKMNLEYEEFLRDLEENPELRFNISLYHNKDYVVPEMSDGDGEPSVPLEELLADLELTDLDNGEDCMEE